MQAIRDCRVSYVMAVCYFILTVKIVWQVKQLTDKIKPTNSHTHSQAETSQRAVERIMLNVRGKTKHETSIFGKEPK